MPTDVRLLGPDDAAMFDRIIPGVFDFAVRPELGRQYLPDPNRLLAVALDVNAARGG